MNNKKIKFAIVGCGKIAPRHAEAIKANQFACLVKVCDIDEAAAKEISQKYECDYTLSFDEILSDKNIDVVSICTPNYLHPIMGHRVAEAGKDCLIEKPLALNYKDALELVEFFYERDRNLFCVLQVRYNPAVKVLKQVISSGALGKIFSCVLTVRWTRPREYFEQSEWRGKRDKDGGTLLTQGIHYIDIMQYVLGDELGRAVANIENVNHPVIEIEDQVQAILKFKGGVSGIIDFTINTFPHNLECSLTVLGKKGTVKIGGAAVNKCEIWEVENLPRPDIPEGLTPNVYAGGLYQGSCPNHALVYYDVIKILNGGNSEFVQGEEALKSLGIIDAIYNSAKKVFK